MAKKGARSSLRAGQVVTDEHLNRAAREVARGCDSVCLQPDLCPDESTATADRWATSCGLARPRIMEAHTGALANIWIEYRTEAQALRGIRVMAAPTSPSAEADDLPSTRSSIGRKKL